MERSDRRFLVCSAFRGLIIDISLYDGIMLAT